MTTASYGISIDWDNDGFRGPGENWVLKKDLAGESPPQSRVLDIVYASGNGLWFAGTQPNAQIWSSSDQGETWALSEDLNSVCSAWTQLGCLAYDSACGIIVAGVTGPGVPAALWASSDGGETWTKKKEFTTSPSQGKVESLGYYSACGILLAGTNPNGQIWSSSDGGENWTMKKDLSNESPPQDWLMAFAFDETNGRIFAATYPNAQIWLSADAGENWGYQGDLSITELGGDSIYALAYDSACDLLFIGGKNYVWESSDAGQSFSVSKDFTATTPPQDRVYWLKFDAQNSELLAGTYPDGQIWKSVNSGSVWELKKDLSDEPESQNAVLSGDIDEGNEIALAGTSEDAQLWKSEASDRDLEEISSYVKRVAFERGRNSELDFCQVGKCELELDNADRNFSPDNASGLYSGSLLPFREIKVTASYSGSQFDLFRGYVKRWAPTPGFEAKDCYLEAVDGFEALRLSKITTCLLEDCNSGSLVQEVLSEAGWSEVRRSIDSGGDTVSWAWWDDRLQALTAVKQIAKSERGVFYFNGAGDAVFEDRYHRLKGDHRASQATFDNVMSEMSCDYSDERIFNDIRVRAFPRAVAANLVNIWQLDEVAELKASEQATFWPSFKDPDTERLSPAKEVASPIETTDYTANTAADGGGVDLSSEITIDAFSSFAESAKIQLTNSGSGIAYLTLLRVRGKPLVAYNPVQARQQDSDSQDAYHRRVFSVDLELQGSHSVADGYARYLLRVLKDPHTQIAATWTNRDASLLEQILRRRISDLVTIEEAQTGVCSNFFLEKVSHEILMGGQHKCTWLLTHDSLYEWGYWILGSGELGSTTRLMY